MERAWVWVLMDLTGRTYGTGALKGIYRTRARAMKAMRDLLAEQSLGPAAPTWLIMTEADFQVLRSPVQ